MNSSFARNSERHFPPSLNFVNHPPPRYAQTDVEFSPDDRLVVTGTSCDKGEEGGKLIFFDKTTFQRAFEMTPTKSHVIRCTWHPKLNQILVGGGDGVVRVFYDPRKSVRGAMLCIVKKRTEAKQSNWLATQRVITPYALPMFKEDKRRQSTTYRQMIKDRKDAKKSHNPDPPMEHKGTGGLVAAGGSTLHSWMAKQIAVKNKDDHIDPRFTSNEKYPRCRKIVNVVFQGTYPSTRRSLKAKSLLDFPCIQKDSASANISVNTSCSVK